jgi:hypothetical protein
VEANTDLDRSFRLRGARSRAEWVRAPKRELRQTNIDSCFARNVRVIANAADPFDTPPSGIRPEPGHDSPCFSACRMIRIVRADIILFLTYFGEGFTRVWASSWISQWQYYNNKCVRWIAHSFLCALLPALHWSNFCSRVAHDLIKFGEVDIMQAELTRQFPDTLNRVEVRTIKRAESRVHPYPTNSQRVSKTPLTSPAYTVEVSLYRPARRSTSFG